jgi:hypothetical protein
MMVKIFPAAGIKKLPQLEADINTWLYEAGVMVKDIRTDVTMCTVTDVDTGKASQKVIVTVWYDN